MRIFILEDDPIRMQWFRERFMNHHVDHADSCEQADLFDPPYDMIFLDHDLGGRQLDDHEDNGAEFVRMVADRIGDAHVIVHSYNPVGSANIGAALPGAYWRAPFRGPWFNNLIDRLLADGRSSDGGGDGQETEVATCPAAEADGGTAQGPEQGAVPETEA